MELARQKFDRQYLANRGVAPVLAALVCACWPFQVSAVDSLALRIGSIHSSGWQAEGVQLELQLAGNTGHLHIARLRLPEPVGELRELKIQCAKLLLNDAVIDCPRAQFQLKGQPLDAPQFTGSFRYQQPTQALQFKLDNLPVGGTRSALSAQYQQDVWKFQLRAPQLTLNSADGKLASEKLALSLSGVARSVPTGWNFALNLATSGGQAYVDPVFLDFAQAPARLGLSGRWQSASRQLVLDSVDIDQPNSLRAKGALTLAFAAPNRLQSLKIQISEATLPRAYASYLQPFLIGTLLDDIETSGQLSGALAFNNGAAQQIHLKLKDVHLDDRKRRFALYGTQGELNWEANPLQPQLSRLEWQGGSAYQMDLGKAQLALQSTGHNLRLLRETRLPVLDGQLQVRRLELAEIGGPAMRVGFDAVLTPVSMERVCRALGWPVFGGTLAGAIPNVEYRDGKLQVGGTLSANVFDGRVEVDKLRLEQPFGALPKMSAEMKLRRIDLTAATSAFSFGRIDGRLDGDIKGLQLLNWRPVAFDGRLYTPLDDNSRHRISQRAIENISDLGGAGAAGVLSRGFLRFFKDFAYDRLALGCRLKDGVCEMSGLEPHRGGGYYIVKGKLLPRIDVIGFATRVNWDAFVEQLKNIRKSEGPVIK